jgi:hypothetical protein
MKLGLMVIVLMLIGAGDATASQCLEPGSVQPRRVALVIGNGAYEDAPLANPVRDARAVSAILKCAGFEVRLATELKYVPFLDTVRDFTDDIRMGDWVAVYYSGHGVQAPDLQTGSDVNFFLPIDNRQIRSEPDLPARAVRMDWIREQISAREPGLGLFLVDACRDNPLKDAGRTKGGRTKGLARVERGMTAEVLHFATAPGDVAEEGTGRPISPYVQALQERFLQPGISVTDALLKVGERVVEITTPLRPGKVPQTPQLVPNIGSPPMLIPVSRAGVNGAVLDVPLPVITPPVDDSFKISLPWIVALVLVGLGAALFRANRLRAQTPVTSRASAPAPATPRPEEVRAQPPRPAKAETGGHPVSIVLKDAAGGEVLATIRLGKSVSVGRDRSRADVALSNDAVSSIHAEIGFDTDGPWIRDSSSNGTWFEADRRRLPRDQKVRIKVGTRLVFGDYHSTLVLESR